MQKVNIILEKLHIKRDKVLPFTFAVGLTLLAFLDSAYFHNTGIFILAILVLIIIIGLITAIYISAGFTVLKSLFLLSAEISLLIFLAQSYCGVKIVSTSSDYALQGLILLGIMYILYEFFKSLRQSLINRLKKVPQSKWSFEKVTIVSLFLVSTVAVIFVIYQVTNPIILDLCVFNR